VSESCTFVVPSLINAGYHGIRCGSVYIHDNYKTRRNTGTALRKQKKKRKRSLRSCDLNSE
jgi:hypothetical protein